MKAGVVVTLGGVVGIIEGGFTAELPAVGIGIVRVGAGTVVSGVVWGAV